MAANCKQELVDIQAETNPGLSPSEQPPRPKGGLKYTWIADNGTSVDGLPGLLTAAYSKTTFKPGRTDWERDHDREFTSQNASIKSGRGLFSQLDTKMMMAFLTGAVVSASYFRFVRSAA